jgi:hypothetical protein
MGLVGDGKRMVDPLVVHDEDAQLGLASESFTLGLVLHEGELVVDIVLQFADGVPVKVSGVQVIHA